MSGGVWINLGKEDRSGALRDTVPSRQWKATAPSATPIRRMSAPVFPQNPRGMSLKMLQTRHGMPAIQEGKR